MSQEQESQEQESQEQESQDSQSQLWRWIPGEGEINEWDDRDNDMGSETIVPILMSIINSLSSPPLPPPNTPLPSPNTPPQQLPNTPPSPNTPLYILSYYTTPPPQPLQPLQPPHNGSSKQNRVPRFIDKSDEVPLAWARPSGNG